jgi:ankyrin repeat protein
MPWKWTTALLLAAARKGNPSAVRALLALGAKVDATGGDGWTALMAAAAAGSAAVVRVLLAAGANLDARERGLDRTALMLAAFAGRPHTVSALLAAGADVHARDGLGVTALMCAAQTDHWGAMAVPVLLEGGADVHEKDRDGVTALMYAAREGHSGAVNVLLAAGAKLGAGDRLRGRTALMLAASGGHTETVGALLARAVKAHQDHGGRAPPVDGRNQFGETAVSLAGRAGHSEVIGLLKGAGAHTDWTALMWATVEGDVRTVRTLLKRGTAVNARTSEGTTALSLAKQVERGDLVGLLTEAGAKE